MKDNVPVMNHRIHTLDAVRGFALLGIVLVNILPLLNAQNPVPGSPDAWMYYFLNFAVESRFFVIFSFLFGVGFHLFISRAKQKGANSTVLFIRRLLVQIVLSPLANYGRMALTNYVGQTVLILAAGYAFDWYGKLGYVQTTLICLGIYLIQMVLSTLWLSVFKMGPLEWLWRAFTYMTIPPLRKTK